MSAYKKYAKLRDERGLTNHKVCVETGIAESTMSEWKKGLYKPKADKLLAIAKLFNVPMEEMLEVNEEVS